MTAHAQTVAVSQTLTPAQTAALEQQLDVAKATLANLEMQAGIVPPADAGAPSTIPASIAGTGSQSATVAMNPPTGLSAAQVSAFSGTLSTLAETLSQLDASLATNTTLSPSQEAAVQATLNGMQGTLVAMANTVAGSENSNVAQAAPATPPVAMKQPSAAPVAINSSPAATAPTTAPATAPTVAVTPATPVAVNQPAPGAAVAPQTAQASSFWSFTKAHWPTIVIVLLVIAILAILFWPEKETVRTVSTGNSGSGKPKSAPSPISTATLPQNTAPSAAKILTENNSVPTPATPMSNAVAAPSQK